MVNAAEPVGGAALTLICRVNEGLREKRRLRASVGKGHIKIVTVDKQRTGASTFGL